MKIIHSLAIVAGAVFLFVFPVSFINTPQTHTVEIKQLKFTPAEIEVKKGDKVVWINRDFFVHDITETGKLWSSDSIIPKASWSRTISESADYFCSLHPMMKGKIVIKN